MIIEAFRSGAPGRTDIKVRFTTSVKTLHALHKYIQISRKSSNNLLALFCNLQI